MGKVGVEPTMFLMSRIYSPLQSPTMLTFPNTFPVFKTYDIPNSCFILWVADNRKLKFITAYGFKIKSLIQNTCCVRNVFLFFAENLKPLFFDFFIFSDSPIYLLYGIYLPEWALSLVSEVLF